MVSTTTLLPILVAFLSALPETNARGCYTSGVVFNGLHGGKDHNLRQEVKNDINTTCRFLNGKVFKSGEAPYRACTNWAKTFADNEGCFQQCIDGCSALPKEYAQGLCKAGCNDNCERKPSGFNRINWEVKLEKGSQKTMTYDICKNAFEKESGACQHGSEQVHDDFWFRIDPNAGSC
jgi:hypothetical protein